MSESRYIRFYNADDWVWVFADDRLIFSGHSISGPQLLRALDYDDHQSRYAKADLPEDALWNVDDSSLDAFPKELFEDD